ncbi:hypothetical protein DCS_04869 [Drechmeria coniospora]|uniref:Uncharacterized protein n=1 Tax=Drechmeria coniospora TaxID=98403 RepID=A0A151GL92_DRECN|nr:hypothetical protein DCS_04869 [Drechmeria coniospora]KYK57856.1 hypothetical protein DCS_04869 [Drechmeria coniospora]ODA83303.1 hypothetical protein RJ55_01816 [Drechmeria coniospora]
MKLLSLLVGASLAGLGLAAPAMAPHQIIKTDDGTTLVRTNIIRVHVPPSLPDTSSSPRPNSVALAVSNFASNTLNLLRLPGTTRRRTPVFTNDVRAAMAVADANGDVVYGSYGRADDGAWGHLYRRPFHICSRRLSLRDAMPFIVLALFFSVFITCSLWTRSGLDEEADPLFDSDEAKKGRLARKLDHVEYLSERDPVDPTEEAKIFL